jgi:hypothetical protein
VEHCYNSHPADIEIGDGYPEYRPKISEEKDKPLKLAAVWSLRPAERGCLNATGTDGISYDCNVQEFGIEEWYSSVVNATDAKKTVETTMGDPTLMRGKLYYNLFQRYDVLVALAKNNGKKLRYGNMQRIVSQTRSGVPILVGVRGNVLEDFMEKYKYKCAFQLEIPSFFPAFEETVQNMEDPKIRRECQRQVLKIAKNYSPKVIGKK